MASLPQGMLTGGRKPVLDFDDNEPLYRAFEEQDLDGDKVAYDAIELPDMSVNRGRFGPPCWLLHLDIWEGCGVASFEVQDARYNFQHLGGIAYRFDVEHTPTPNNYPHSEVCAFEGARHIEPPEPMDPAVHLRYRNRLRQRLRVVIRPGEYTAPK